MNYIGSFKAAQFAFLFFMLMVHYAYAVEENTQNFFLNMHAQESQEGQQKRSENFKYFAKTGECKGCDLSGLDLRKAIEALRDAGKAINLEKATLYNCNMEGANLQGANFVQADLTRACLDGADLSEAELFMANLTKTSLKNAKLMMQGLRGFGYGGAFANFTRANLSGAYVSGRFFKAEMKNAVCVSTQFGDKRRFYGSRISARYANFKHAQFKKAKMSEVNFERADFAHGQFVDVEGISVCFNDSKNVESVKGNLKNLKEVSAQGLSSHVKAFFGSLQE